MADLVEQYRALLADQSKDDAGRAAYILGAASSRSPDTVAEAVKVGRETGVPADVAERNLGDVRRLSLEQQYRVLLADSPRTARFLTDPTNAALTQEDAQKLVQLENTWGSMTQRQRPLPSFDSVFRGFQQSAALKGVGASLDLVTHDLIWGRKDSAYRRHLEKQADLAQSEIDISTPEFESDTARAIYSGGTSLAQQASGLVVGIVTGNPAIPLGVAGITTAAPAYTKYSGRGATGTEAALGAVGEGATEVLTEIAPMGLLVAGFGKVGAGKFLAGLLGREIPGEQVATIVQDAIDTAVANPNKTWGEYLKERPGAAYQTAVATVTQAGAMGAVSAGLHKIAKERYSAKNAAVVAQQLADAVAAVQESKLATRDPETMAAFIRQVAGDGSLYVPAESLSELYQSGVIDQATFDALDVAEQLPEALAAGGDVLIAPDKYLLATARLTPEALSQVISNTRRGATGMTAAEAEAFLSDAPARDRDISDLLERMAIQYEGQEPGHAVEDDVASALAGWPGQTKTSAQPVAALWRERYLQRARDRGMDPDALWVEERPQFLGPRPVLPADDLDLVLERLRSGRAVQTPRQPVLGIFRAAGGVRPGSDLAQDLQAMGITPSTAPGLFRDNGIGAADRIIVAEHEVLRDNGVRADANGYAEHDALMQAVGREWAGDPLQTENERARIERLDQPVRELRAALEAQGIVPEFATKDDIRRLVEGGNNALRQAFRPRHAIEFTRRIDGLLNGTLHPTDTISTGPVARALSAVGLVGRDLMVAQNVLRKVLQGKHGSEMDPEVVRRLPDLLADPVAIFDSATVPGSFVVLLDAADKAGSPVIVAVAPGRQNHQPAITSVYGKDRAAEWVSAQIGAGRLRYFNNEKSREFGQNSGVQFPGKTQTTGSGKKILTDSDFVKPLAQPGGEQIRGSYDPVTDTIRAFDQADLSTVLHEGGHRWLFEMIGDLADPRVLPEARARIVRDLQTVMDWLGVKIDVATASPEALREALTVEHHEQWARGSEAYLMEGKAPSAALRPVFARFSAWLTRIYRTALNLDVRLTPQVRGVFDRLLASDAAIAEAEADSVYRVPSELSGVMTAAERREIEAAQERAAIEARAELQTRVMRELARERLAWWREEKGKVRKEVEAGLRQQPAYRLIDLSKGLGPDGQKLPDDRTLKLDRRVLVAEYGEEIIGLLPKGVTAAKGGVNHHIVAGMLGAENGDALRLALMEARATPLKTAIARETDRIMHERHGDMVTDGRIAEDAADIVATSHQLEAVALQAKYLRRLAARPIQRVAERKQAVEGAGRVTDDHERVEQAEAGIDQTLNAGAPAEGTTTAQVVAAVAQAEIPAARTQRAAQSAAAKQVRALLARLDHAAIRDIAEKFIQTRIVSQAISAERYRACARRHERAAELAIAKRDYGAALAEKQQQLLNMELEAFARQARQEVEKIERRGRRLNKSDAKLAKTTDQDFFNAARAILAHYGLARADDAFDARTWIERLRGDDPEGAADVETMISNLTSYSTYGRVASKIMPDGRRIDVAPDYRDMKMADLLDLRDGVAALLAMGRNARTAEIDGERIAFEDITAQMQAQLEGRVKPRDMSRDLTQKERAGLSLLGTIAALRRVEHWARDMDNGKVAAMTRFVLRPVFDSVYAYRDAKRAILPRLLAVLRPGMGDLARPRTISAAEIGFTFDNKGQLIHAILHSGNESNLRKLLLGRGWGKEGADGTLDRSRWDEFLGRMWAEGVVTQTDMNMVQGIWDLLESTKPAAQKAHRQMFGYNFKEIEEKPIQTPWGQYRGGYVPAIIDRDQSTDSARHLDTDDIGSPQNAAMFPAAAKGFTKSRTDYVGPLALDLTLIPAHVNKVLLFSYVGPAIRQTARLIKRNDFGALMSSIDPTAINDLLIPWLSRTARQAVDTPMSGRGGRWLDSTARYLRRTAGMQAMVGNIVNAAQQFTGIASAAAIVPPSALGRSLITVWRNPEMTRAAITAKSSFMRDRLDSASREIGADIDNILRHRGPLGQAQAFAMRHGYFAQQMAQDVVDRIVWAAAYDTAASQGIEDAEAVRRADAAVRQSQGSFNPEDIARVEGGSPFFRMFTMFYSYFGTQANLLYTEAGIAVRTAHGRELARRLGALYLFGGFLPAVVAEAITQAARGELGDEDDDGWLDDLMSLFVLSQIRFFAAFVPGAGQFSNFLLNLTNDRPYDDRLSTAPAISMLESAGRSVLSVPKAVFAGGDKSRAVSDSLNAIGAGFGIPTGFLRKPLSYATDVAEGDSRPRHVGNVVSGILTGQDGTAR